MPDLSELQRLAAGAREARDAARGDLRRNSLRLQEIDQQLAQARREPQREGRSSVAALERERASVVEAVSGGRDRVAGARERLVGDLNRFFVDPSMLVEQLDDRLPFLLFPVRIETRFSAGAEGTALLVRIFPDDIAIAHHERELTVAEQEAGHQYWRTRARANREAHSADRDRIQRGAWNVLAQRYGAYRASWITRATQPAGWSNATTDPDTLAFPSLVTKPAAWTDTPRSPVMPDVFTVVLQRGQTTRSVTGNFVPDDLPLGPDPLHVESIMTRDSSGRLKVSDDLRWLTDFEQAVSAGMGVKVPLSAQEAAEGFDRVLVLGVRLSTDASESAALVTRLMDSHRFSQGLSIVPQGAPTNNTDDAASGLSTVADSVDETYALEHDPTAFPTSGEPMHQLDGERLSRALGIPLDLVRTLPHSRRSDIAESVAMHRALWGATLGHFVKEMLDKSFSAQDIERVRLFLTEFVHGRGVVPAIRVGSQPYGILVTSAFSEWTWSEIETGGAGDFWPRLQTQLGVLRQHWASLAKEDVSFVGKRDAQGNLLDQFATLIDIIGLQASSVEFWSRTGVPDSYLKALAAYRNNDASLVNNWIANAKNNRTLELGNAHIPLNPATRLKDVLFLEQIDRISPPVIDSDPGVPLSEEALIRPYDGTPGHNYLYWFATASTADLQNQRFVGADGTVVPPPAALLYRLLRVSMLSELYTASKLIATRVRPEIFAEAPLPPDMPNVAGPVLMPGHFAMVDAGRLGLAERSVETGDYLLEQSRALTSIIQKPPEAAPLAAMSEALQLLANLPTARLERLFAEHIDVVSYRLDAWLAALFARRLKYNREARQGSYIGAYGWVENLRPSTTRQAVPAQQIPEELRSAVDGPVVSYTDNGGFVHAPSLPHAVTAAVLRNAYLTHVEEQKAKQMSVNLSSGRVRTALAYIEGLQNGQELGALLGYQLERGLHEGHPGIELDSVIYVLRARFPLISKKLTPTPDGLAAEVVEARNVVNGYDLLDFTKDKTYPYGIAGLPVEPGKVAAIEDEIDRLRDAMDAVADLLLAESVHQVAQGNYDRARGAVQALTDAELPPLPDVIQTPRSGRSLNHRVAVFFAPGMIAGWHASLTPRAAANAPLNHWLSTLLPAPGDIQWKATLGAAAPEFVDAGTLALEPIDIVMMSGDRLGDLTSSLERLLVADYRRTRAVADDVVTCFAGKTNPSVPVAKMLVFDPDLAQPGKYSIGSLLPLLKALRRLVTTSRPLGARDLGRSIEAQNAHPENPQGFDGPAPPLQNLGDLKSRLEGAHVALKTAHAQLSTVEAAMALLIKDLDDNPSLPPQPGWTPLVAQGRVHLRTILQFGIPEAMPSGGATISDALVREEHGQVRAVAAIVKAKLETARTLLDIAFTNPLPTEPRALANEKGRRVTARLDAYTQAAKELLGSDYVAIPLFQAHLEGAAELAAATTSPVETDPLVIESWLQAVARVRPAMQAWEIVAMYKEWMHGATPSFSAIQLPVAPGATWIGGAFGDTVKAADVVSVVAHQAPAAYGAPTSGLLLDEWTELVPAATETTGLAMHVNRPNAVAPQALLVAVAPKQTGRWSWPHLVAILNDTLDRAKLRAVEPDAIGYPYFQLLPPIVSSFDNRMLMATAELAHRAVFATRV